MELLQKLHIKPGITFRVVHKPRGLLMPIQKGNLGLAILIFVTDKKELQEALRNKKFLSAEYLWIAYKKGAWGKITGLNRDILSYELAMAGYDSVSIVAIDLTWSALRFKKM